MSAPDGASGARAGAARRRIGVGVVGFGWMGQAHSRSLLRAPTLFPDGAYRAHLVSCADPQADRRRRATADFGFAEATGDWRRTVEHPQVDAVWVAAPNRLHADVVAAAAGAGKAVFCEKPVGGTPAQTVRAHASCQAGGVTTGVGYNFRWAPLVRYARRLIDDEVLGEVVHYRGSFFSMYGADPLGVRSWRYLLDEGGHGVTSDLLCHSIDLAAFLVSPVARVLATTGTFITDRPLPAAGGTHYARGRDGDPTGPVTNEDYVGALAVLRSGARATFEACRTLVGPESDNTFTVYGTRAAVSWSLETLNELRLYEQDGRTHRGWTTVRGGERFPYHGAFAPGDANGIGFEDLVAIEDHEFCSAVVDGRPFRPDLGDAVASASVQQAVLRSAADGAWADVEDLSAAGAAARKAGGGSRCAPSD